MEATLTRSTTRTSLAGPWVLWRAAFETAALVTATAVAVGEAGSLLLHVILVAALRRIAVAVALGALPRTLLLEVDKPRGVGIVVEQFAHCSVPRIRVHRASVDPYGGAGGGGTS